MPPDGPDPLARRLIAAVAILSFWRDWERHIDVCVECKARAPCAPGTVMLRMATEARDGLLSERFVEVHERLGQARSAVAAAASGFFAAAHGCASISGPQDVVVALDKLREAVAAHEQALVTAERMLKAEAR